MALDYDVAVIGAGAAGIAAARKLTSAGRSVVILEASNRIGGRAWTIGLCGMPLDLGCGWLHSAKRNPFSQLGREAGFSIERTISAWQSQWHELGFSKAERSAARSVWEAFNERIRRDPPETDRASDALDPDGEWNQYCQSLSAYLNGAPLEQLSIRDFLAYDDAATDDNWRVKEGYGSLITSCLPTDAAVQLSTPIRRVALTGDGVRVETDRNALLASAVIVTASTNVLARGMISFDREVDDHLQAATQLPLGLADKLFIRLEGHHGLEPETHLLGNPRDSSTGSYYIRPMGRQLIEGFYGGEGAARLETAGLMDAFAFASDELASLIGNRIRSHLKPLIASTWCAMDWIHGSYSHAVPGASQARILLAQPVEDRLFFAGEATHPQDFSTAHGAWDSGLRAAGEVLAVMTS